MEHDANKVDAACSQIIMPTLWKRWVARCMAAMRRAAPVVLHRHGLTSSADPRGVGSVIVGSGHLSWRAFFRKVDAAFRETRRRAIDPAPKTWMPATRAGITLFQGAAHHPGWTTAALWQGALAVQRPGPRPPPDLPPPGFPPNGFPPPLPNGLPPAGRSPAGLPPKDLPPKDLPPNGAPPGLPAKGLPA